MTTHPCPICLEARHDNPLACPVLGELMERAADVEVPPRLVDDGLEVRDEATPAYLARVLADHGAPAHMVSLAADGHYDDFLSPLALPELQLLADARANGLDTIAVLVVAGAFDSTKAESDAWAASPDGQATFAELRRGPNRAARRRQHRRGRR